MSMDATIRRKTSSGFVRSTLRRILVSRKGFAGIFLVLLFVFLAYARPLFSPYPPLRIGVGTPNQPPTPAHLMGTTSLGQDVYSQFLAGGLVSVIVGLSTGIFASALAALVGIPSGYYRGRGGRTLTLVTDVFLIIPVLPLIILLGVYVGPSIITQIILLTLLSWPLPARVIRSQVLSLRERAFIESAVAAGSTNKRIMFGEILPNVVPLILSNGILIIVFAILLQAAISFLGLGIPSLASWGDMLYNAELTGAVSAGQWWWVVPPGLGIMTLAFGFSLIVLQLDRVLSDWSQMR